MSLIRAILNNGFFIIVLIIAITLYLMYSDKIKRDHGITSHSNTSIVETNDTPSPVVQKTTQNSEPNVSEQPQKTEETNLAETSPSTENKETQSANNNNSNAANTNTTDTLVENNAHKVEKVETEVQATTKPTENDNVNSQGSADNAPQADEKTPQLVVNTPHATENAPQAVENTSKSADAVATTEKKSNTKAHFANLNEALVAAKKASAKNDFTKAAAIYLDIAKKQPSPSILGYLANSLYQEGKATQAGQAWLDSAKLLVKEHRLQDANMLASRLVPYAPKVAHEIHMNVQRIYQKQMALRQHNNQVQNASNKPLTNFQPQQAMKPMPQMQTMQPMQAMQPMPQMQKVQPMPPMHKMPNYNTAPQSNQQFLKMQQQQRAQYQRYLDYMRKQASMMRNRMNIPSQQNNLHYSNGQ